MTTQAQLLQHDAHLWQTAFTGHHAEDSSHHHLVQGFFLTPAWHRACRGCTGLLYTPTELTTPARRTAQAVLLQHEAQLLQEAFNQRFAASQAAKADLIALLEEKAGRVDAIERELGLSSSATSRPTALVRVIACSGSGIYHQLSPYCESRSASQQCSSQCGCCCWREKWVVADLWGMSMI